MGDANHPYGATNAPVFSCGEMERLVMMGQALGDPQGRNLPQRVIRQIHSGAGNRPGWMGGDAATLSNGAGMANGAYGTNGSAATTRNDYNPDSANGSLRPSYGRNPTQSRDVQ